MRFFPLALLLAAPSYGWQTTWFVDVNAPGPGSGSFSDPFGSIGQGLQAGADGDSVCIRPGLYMESLDLAGKALVVYAEQGLGSAVIDGGGTTSTVRMVNGEGQDTVLRDLSMTGGIGTLAGNGERLGGGLYLLGASPLIERCRFAGNSADRGGGLFSLGGEPRLVDCTLQGNEARFGAGAYVEDGRLSALRTMFEANQFPDPQPLSFDGAGVGLWLGGSGTGSVFLECDFLQNKAGRRGRGGGAFLEVDARFVDCLFEGNQSSIFAGPIQILEDYDAAGGGLYTASGAVQLTNCRFLSNYGGRFGGGVYGDVYAEDCEFHQNQAGVGGGAYLGRYVRCDFTSNVTNWGQVDSCLGGGASGAVLSDCLLAGNVGMTNSSGGGASQCMLFSCTVQDNFVDAFFDGFGAGLHECYAEDCEILGNRTQGSQSSNGGGAYASVLLRCIVAFNEAEGSSSGPNRAGGLAECTATQCTIVGNVAGPALSGSVAGGSFGGVLNSCILWDNGPGQVGAATTVSHSLVQGGAPGAGNLDLNPQFWGPVSGDFQLTAASPAIDSGDPTLPPDADGSVPDRGAWPFDGTYVGAPGLYCQPKGHAIGCVPTVVAAGSPTLSGLDDFELQASDLLNTSFAMLLLGPVPANTPLGSGTLCVGAVTARVGPFVTGGSPPPAVDCSGTAQAGISQAELASLGVGTTAYGQLLVRDPQNPDGSNLAATQGVEFRVLP